MGTLKLSVPHRLGPAEAKARMQKLLAHWVQKFGVHLTWSGETASVVGKVMGVNLNASLEIGETSVDGSANDPGMLVRNQAKKYLEGKIATFLDPSKKLADFD